MFADVFRRFSADFKNIFTDFRDQTFASFWLAILIFADNIFRGTRLLNP